MHNPSEFGSNRCSVGAPMVLSDGLFGFRPLLATMILSTTFPPPSLLLCKVQTALGIVTYNPRYASTLIEKLLKSAIANAENNNGMHADTLYVAECYADKGPTMKRIRPRAQGRAYRIEKRMSHITIVLDEKK